MNVNLIVISHAFIDISKRFLTMKINKENVSDRGREETRNKAKATSEPKSTETKKIIMDGRPEYLKLPTKLNIVHVSYDKSNAQRFWPIPSFFHLQEIISRCFFILTNYGFKEFIHVLMGNDSI